MKNVLVTLIVVVVAFLAIWKIWPSGNSAQQTNTPTMTPTASVSYSPTATPKTSVSPSSSVSPTVSPSKQPVSVLITNFAFSPANIVVRQGTKVTWTNNDTVPHIVRGDKGVPVSPSLAPGQSYSFTFNTVGTYKYHSSLYPATMGTVEVVK